MFSDSRSILLMMSFAAGTFAAGASSNPRHLLLALPDNGIPNSPLPLIIYPQVLPDDVDDAAAWFETAFASHGWPARWRATIHPYPHYHPDSHELLGVACGWAEVLFGGESGRMVTLHAGDAVLIPAGVGHQQIAASEDFLVVGAYPHQLAVRTLRNDPAEMTHSLEAIKRVPLPPNDPITGGAGALTEVWHSTAQDGTG